MEDEEHGEAYSVGNLVEVLEDEDNDQSEENIKDQPVDEPDAESPAPGPLGSQILHTGNDADWLPMQIHRAVSIMSCGEKRSGLPLFRVHRHLGVVRYGVRGGHCCCC